MIRTVFLVFLLSIFGAMGGYVSWFIRNHNWSVLWSFIPGTASTVIWAYMAKYLNINLIKTSLIFDVVYNVTWIIALVVMGETLTPIQWLGALFIIVGLALLN